MFSKLKLLLITVLAFSYLHGADELVIDTKHSHVTFKIKHLMISNVNGEFRKFDGDLFFDIKTKRFTKFTGEIDATSIDTGIEKRDNHLRSPDFFDVKKYPTINFVMTKTDGDNIYGDLTIHGVTKEVKLAVEEISGPIKDLRGETRYAFVLEGKINRKDFGLTWNKALEAGGVVVGDKVKITLELATVVM